MKHTAIAVCAVLAFAAAAHASSPTLPPRKPGLWQIDYSAGGAGVPSLAGKIASLPPERRARAEAVMKAQGMGIASNLMTLRFCLTPEEAADASGERLVSRLRKGEPQSRCEREIVERTATSLRFHSVCHAPDGGVSEQAGHIYDVTPDAFAAELDIKLSEGRNMHLTERGRWVASDCGAVN
ncbi:MAG: DUF3617 family protein [Burkholderiales bacterium]|nr:DUF3617 family protein [Burkholderiales bacterium]